MGANIGTTGYTPIPTQDDIMKSYTMSYKSVLADWDTADWNTAKTKTSTVTKAELDEDILILQLKKRYPADLRSISMYQKFEDKTLKFRIEYGKQSGQFYELIVPREVIANSIEPTARVVELIATYIDENIRGIKTPKKKKDTISKKQRLLKEQWLG